jgi:thermitase
MFSDDSDRAASGRGTRGSRSRRLRRARVSRGTLAESLESLERRSMLSATVIDVSKVTWNGSLVDAVKDEYVFRMPQLNKATSRSPLDYAHKAPTLRPGWSVQSLGMGFYKLNAPGASQTAITGWARGNGVSSVTVNAVRSLSAVPGDPLYGRPENWAFEQISAPGAWDVGTGNDSTIVAVLDSGVDFNHPDLADNMWRNPNEVAGDGIDNDGNGWVDDVFGVNTIGGNTNVMDDNGHGTFVAGLIGAVGDNAVGMAGVNWTTRIMAVKIADANWNTTISAVVQGVNYVTAQKVAGQNIAASNHSYGGSFFVQQEFDALTALAQTGVVVVAAAGNDSSNNDLFPVYPANYTIPGLISVAASTQADTLAPFSNYGVATVDLAAPGVSLLSTRSSQADAGYVPLPGEPQYAVASGTSFAAPLVAGAAGLLKSLKLSASPEQIKTAILNGVDKVSGLNGLVLTGGRLNLDRSVDLILSTVGATPVATFTSGQNLAFIEGDSGYTFADVKVSLDRPVDRGRSVSVRWQTAPGGSAHSGLDFVPQAGYVTFSGSQTEKSFRVRIVGDRVVETDEGFAVQLVQAQSPGVTIGTSTTIVTVLDDDYNVAPVQPAPTAPPLVPRISVDGKRDTAGALLPVREGDKASFVISLDRTSDKVVTVQYRTTQPVLVPVGTALAGVDYVATSGTLTFRPGERSKEITVSILADKVADDGETFHLVLTAPTNAELAGGTAGTGGAFTATIQEVAYVPPPAPGFQITLSFPDSSFTTTQQAVFQQAAQRWQQIIIGDLPNVVDPATGRVIDDILIVATAPAIDGAGGILGGARPTEFRPGVRGLPWKGEMSFDAADVATLESNGQLVEVVLHEMAHALGFGSLWAQFGLLRNAGTDDPIYVGVNALREYRSLFGLATATGVPVENTGGPGTADAHWRESVFDTELMTGYLNPGVKNPISRMTVGAFQDLGYQVNYARADVYAKPAAVRAGAPSRPSPPAGSGLKWLVAGQAEAALASVSSARPVSSRGFAALGRS